MRIAYPGFRGFARINERHSRTRDDDVRKIDCLAGLGREVEGMAAEDVEVMAAEAVFRTGDER